MKYYDIVFDGPPESPAPRFVEVEDDTGKSINLGDWVERDDGYWALRVTTDEKPLPDLDLPGIVSDLATDLYHEHLELTAILRAIKANDMTVRDGVKAITLIRQRADA